jgi:hypothetical protein
MLLYSVIYKIIYKKNNNKYKIIYISDFLYQTDEFKPNFLRHPLFINRII